MPHPPPHLKPPLKPPPLLSPSLPTTPAVVARHARITTPIQTTTTPPLSLLLTPRKPPLPATGPSPPPVAGAGNAAANAADQAPQALAAIRSDFDTLRERVVTDKWTDDTPVPPDAFGPLWPNGLTPDWAKETT